MRLHLGCGGTILDGFINVDKYSTAAYWRIDALEALQGLPEESVELIYSNGFLEHLARPQAPFIKECYRVLRPDGIVLHLGIPDFMEVARCYLDGRAGVVDWDGGQFGLENVYRYTHGLPEAAPDYMGQLHKDVFDADKLRRLGAVFPLVDVIKYRYPDEPHPLCLGLILSKGAPLRIELLNEDFIYGVDVDSVRFA